MTASPTRFEPSNSDPWRYGPSGHHEHNGHARHRSSSSSSRFADWSEAYTDALVARVAQVCDGHKPTPLAARLNLHPETVRRYLNGQRPSPEFLFALCRELGISAQWLLLGEGDMHQPGRR